MRIVRVARHRLPEDPNRAPIWLIGLTDLITILLAFFILLYSTSEPRTKSFDTASQSLRDRFGDRAPVADRTGEAGEKADKTWKSVELKDGLNLDYLASLMKKFVAGDPVLQNVIIWRHEDSIVLSFGAEMGFAPGTAALSSAGERMIAALTPFLTKLPNQLEIVGHADAVPIAAGSTYDSNWQLSLDRARQVALALQARGYGQPATVSGRGTTDVAMLPKDLSDDARNALARRVDLRLKDVR